MRTLSRALLLPAVALAFSAAGGRAAERPRVDSARDAFAILDMDGDRKVTFKEFAYRKIEAFSAPDRNDDGYLSPDEILLTPEQFEQADRDGDGAIRLLEFIDSRYGQFDIYDADKNGTVDLQEFTYNLVGP